jgi:hypothetical protein
MTSDSFVNVFIRWIRMLIRKFDDEKYISLLSYNELGAQNKIRNTEIVAVGQES